MKKLIKNKSAIFEAGGMGLVLKIAITLIAAGLFLWLVTKMMTRYV